MTHDLVLPSKPAEHVTPRLTRCPLRAPGGNDAPCGFTHACPVAGADGTGCALSGHQA